ncbi:SOS response-associated peptidase [Chitinimonas sp.]|uniref:SOS response-associated peptidase n=1 Tax=Chitinimonas sp. TaxID=1934313 RepID=UPI002F943F55
MCVNYFPVSNKVLEEQFLARLITPEESPTEAWKGQFAAMLVKHRQTGERVATQARFGLLPHFAQEVRYADKTYNARMETVAELPSYKPAWTASRFCLIPMCGFCEPCYESGQPERWQIGMEDDAAFAVAGIWSWWRNPHTQQGEASFSMLTINADEHPLMRRFHAPGDEKRMPVIIHPENYDRWLSATPEQARALAQPFPADLMRSLAAPLPKLKQPSPNFSLFDEPEPV